MLIEAQLALGDAAAAEASVILLDQIAAAREPPVLAARAALARGMVAQHRSQRDAAREAFEYGLAALADFRWPLLLAELRLRLGQVLAEPDAPAAIAEARAAHLRTIEHHVSAILAKLGLRSRAEAAVYAASLETAQPLTAEA